MLNENLKTLRKNKGYSQEQLAVRLNVVRQTVSKWEKGLSVPDAQMLMEIAEVLSVSVNELLGNDIEQETKKDTLEVIAQELAKLNELIAIEQHKKEEIKKKIVEIIGIIIILCFGGDILEVLFDVGRQLGNAIGDVLWK